MTSVVRIMFVRPALAWRRLPTGDISGQSLGSPQIDDGAPVKLRSSVMVTLLLSRTRAARRPRYRCGYTGCVATVADPALMPAYLVIMSVFQLRAVRIFDKASHDNQAIDRGAARSRPPCCSQQLSACSCIQEDTSQPHHNLTSVLLEYFRPCEIRSKCIKCLLCILYPFDHCQDNRSNIEP